MKFYFPKEQYNNYGVFERLDYDNFDSRVCLCLHFDLRMLWIGFRKRLRGKEVVLYHKEDGGYKDYATVKLRSNGLVDRVLTAHITFEYADEILDMFKEFNSLCDKGVLFGKGVAVDMEIGRSRLIFPNRRVDITMNNSVKGILSYGKEYFDVVNLSLMFNYVFSKYVSEYGCNYKWIDDKIIGRCKFYCDNVFKPLIDSRLDVMKKVMSKVEYIGGSVEMLVYEYFEKYDVLDLDMPPIDLYNMLCVSGYTLAMFKDAVYDLWKKGVLIPVDDIEFTFNSKGQKMPRRFKLKKP